MKRVIILIIALLVTAATLMPFVSCDSISSQEKGKQKQAQKRQEKAEAIERRIITPEDFYVFASRTSDTASWSDIDDVIQCMSADKFVNLVDKYVNYLVNFSKTDVTRAKVYAILLSALPMYIPDDKEQYKRLQVDILNNSPYFNLTHMILGLSLGKDGFDNVQYEYVRAIKDNGKLYNGQIIPLEKVTAHTLSLKQLKSDKDQSHKQYNISTTEDWINFVSDAYDIEEIDKALTSMKPEKVIQIAKELSEIVSNLKANEPQAKEKCKALIYITAIPVPHQIVKEKYAQAGRKYTGFCFSDSEYDEFNRIFNDKPGDKVITILGNKEVNEIFGAYEEWAKSFHLSNS